MTSRRLAKIAQAIKETVSTTVLFQLRDPRISNVTVLHVEVAPDVQSAKVYISIMGDQRTKALCMHGLESARGFIQSKIADRIQTRYTPVIKFVQDTAVKDTMDTLRILDELQHEREQEEATQHLSSEEDGPLEEAPPED